MFIQDSELVTVLGEKNNVGFSVSISLFLYKPIEGNLIEVQSAAKVCGARVPRQMQIYALLMPDASSLLDHCAIREIIYRLKRWIYSLS